MEVEPYNSEMDMDCMLFNAFKDPKLLNYIDFT